MARKILLADDSVTAQNMGRKILADAGYEVIAVNNGSAALKKIIEMKPDLVILDVYMPGYSGLEVCQRLKESPETARIPVLLTVGKLEPFKPEEAQRVRAEGYIVKPFEASELLSALSKLEDKVVPRAEASKPGRFARAIAVVEEAGRSSRRQAGEDNGWKSRISFPHQKTEEEQKEEKLDDQPSTYNQFNRDLRTVVETPAEKAKEISDSKRHESTGRETETVDVAALAPPAVASALPTDVTQEEVAAIAAAAAQMQIATAAVEEDRRAFENATQSKETLDKAGFEPPIREIELETAQPPTTAQESSTVSETAEGRPERNAERTERESSGPAAQDLPVTMAANPESVASSSGGASRWSAVAVDLNAEEAALSLEHEMQKVYAVSQTEPAPASVPETVQTSSETSLAPAETTLETQSVTPEIAATDTELAHHDASSPVDSAPIAKPVCVDDSASAAAPMTETREDFASAPTEPAAFEASGEAYQVPESGEPAATEPASAEPYAQAEESSHPAEIPGSEMPDSQQTGADAASFDQSQQSESAMVSEPTEIPASSTGFTSFIQNSEQPEAEQHAESAPDEDALKSTAAAWASWRQIRDSKATESAPSQSPQSDPSPAVPAEETAKAVAAGAEHILQAAANAESSANPSDVASIVDSVLADLRPKLMEEISRKMSEKK